MFEINVIVRAHMTSEIIPGRTERRASFNSPQVGRSYGYSCPYTELTFGIGPRAV